jgi:protein-tyrosine phosphatase
MAEYIFRHQLNKSGFWKGKVNSAGVSALSKQPADAIVRKLLLERSIDATYHRSTQLTDEHVREANLVLVMENYHRDIILDISPSARGKTYLLGHWNQTEIHDPYQGSKREYKETIESIEFNVSAWIHKIHLDS